MGEARKKTKKTTKKAVGRAIPARPSGRDTLQDRVLARLQHALMSGIFIPGQILSLRKVATSFGTSSMPVRESFSRLIAARALEELPNRTVRVPKLSRTELIELFEVRRLVEGMATRIASERADEFLIAELKAINDELLLALRDKKMDTVLAANQKFHFAMYRAANSGILMPLIENLWLRCGPTMYYALNSPDNSWDSSLHIEVLRALKRGDVSRVCEAMVADISVSGDYLIGLAAKQPRSGPFASLSLT